MGQKKYTVLHHDDTHFLMQHPNGSNFKVSKRNLDPRTAAEIQKMSEGGDVEPTYDTTSDVSDGSDRNIASESSSTPFYPTQDGRAPVSRMELPVSSQIASGDGSGEVPTVAPQAPAFERDKPMGEEGAPSSSVSTNKPFYPTPTGEAPQPREPAANSTPVSAGQAKGQSSSADGSGLYDFEKQQLKGVRDEAAIKAKQGLEDAAVYGTLAKDLKSSHDEFVTKLKRNDERSEKLFQEAMDSKIDPNRYWENKSTGGKISAAIGIALAGIGGGMGGQGGNMALDVINKAIDRDIDAQKANLSNKNSLLSKNLEMTHNLESAVAMTRADHLAIAAAQVAKIAGTNAGPLAQALSTQLQGQLKEHYKTINTGLAQSDAQMHFIKEMDKAAASGVQFNPSDVIRYKVPEKHIEKAHEELDRVQKFNDRSENIMRLFDEAAKENTAIKTGGGLLRTPPAVAALNVELESLAKDKDGRVNEMVLKDMKKNAPGSFNFEGTIQEKRKNMNRMLQEGSQSSLLDSYHVPYRKAPTEAPAERVTKDGKIALFDRSTKKFLGYK